MDHAQAFGHLPDNLQSARRGQHLALVLTEVATGDKFHGQVVTAVFELVDVVNGDDGRMIQRGNDVPFIDKALDKVVLGSARQHLDRHLALQRILGGQVHLGHAAFAQLAVDGVTGNLDQWVAHSQSDRY